MKRRVRVLTAVLIATTLAASIIGPAVAEPGKNRIEAETSSCSDGQTYAFVLNGMGKAWHIKGSNANLVVKRYTLTYFDPNTGEPISDPISGEPISETYGGGNKNGLKGSLISCVGETTTELQGLGRVRVVAEFDAFVTPQGGG
jgi:hypothetical protein